MKNEFILHKAGKKAPILVNEKSHADLLQRCQDHWYHTKDIKYSGNQKWTNKLGFSSNKNKAEFLFIHIPKTGGTSFKFNVLYSPHLDKKVAVYHKFNYPAKHKSDLNIFTEKMQMFTLLRDPLNTVISAYFHFNHLQKLSFSDFCFEAKNMQSKFLLGYDICSDYEVTESDLEKLIDFVKKGRLTIGCYKPNKMKAVYDLLELSSDKVDQYLLNKKEGIQYQSKEVSADMKNYIKRINALDYQLFEALT